MFLKETRVKRKSGRVVTYLQLVVSVWDKKKKAPRHKVLCSFGRLENLDKQQIANLVEKLSSYLDEPSIALDDRLKVGKILGFGIASVVQGVWKSLKLDQFFASQLKQRKYEKTVHQAIIGMVINRCQQPESKRAIHQWLSEEVYFPAAQQLTLENYYQAMDFLRDTGQDLELALYDHYAQPGETQPELVFYDTTNSYFETHTEENNGLCQHGYSRDHRDDRRQILVGLTVDRNGLPLASDIFPGNTQDVSTVKRMVTRFCGMGIKRCIFVSGSEMVSDDNLKALAEAELQTLVCTRMRQASEVQQHALSKRGRFIKLPGGLGVKEVKIDSYRYIVVRNEKQAQKDAKVRDEAIERLGVILELIAAGKASVCDIQHRSIKRFVRQLKDGTVKLNATKVHKDAKYDGKHVLRTTSDLALEDAIAAYKTLYQIEQSFRTIKNVLHIRPIYHHADHRIESHVKLCVLAYFIVRHIEIKTGQSWQQVAQKLRQLHVVELKTSAGVVLRRSDLSKEQRAIFKALGIDPPKEIQKVHLNS